MTVAFCPECGPLSSTDEDGCQCLVCEITAERDTLAAQVAVLRKVLILACCAARDGKPAYCTDGGIPQDMPKRIERVVSMALRDTDAAAREHDERIRADERERCAGIAEKFGDQSGMRTRTWNKYTADAIAAAIREGKP